MNSFLIHINNKIYIKIIFSGKNGKWKKIRKKMGKVKDEMGKK